LVTNDSNSASVIVLPVTVVVQPVQDDRVHLGVVVLRALALEELLPAGRVHVGLQVAPEHLAEDLRHQT